MHAPPPPTHDHDGVPTADEARCTWAAWGNGYSVYSLGAPQYYRRVFWTDYDVPDTIIDFDPSPVRVCGEQGCLITVDWTPPVDNGLPITIYEIKYRCPDGPATCPEDTIATSSQGEGYTVASLCMPLFGANATTVTLMLDGVAQLTALRAARYFRLRPRSRRTLILMAGST